MMRVVALALILSIWIIQLTHVSSTCETEYKYLTSDGVFGDRAGEAVAISGTTAIVGAHRNNELGAAYILVETTPGAWSEIGKLTASDGAVDDRFGWAVAIDNNYAVVSNRKVSNESAYIFKEESPNVWSEVAHLFASDGADDDLLGYNLDLSGTTVIIGAFQDDDTAWNSGSMYIFTETSPDVWTETKHVSTDPYMLDQFGWDVAIDGTNAFVTAPYDDDYGYNSGSCYLFTLSTSWTETQKLGASDGEGGDFFGYSVDVHGTNAIIGAFKDNDGAYWSGSVYVFSEITPGVWVEFQKLTASDPEASDFFGVGAAIYGTNMVLGAYASDDFGSNSGSVYLFSEVTPGVEWRQVQKVVASDGFEFDSFGYAVDITETTIVAGARGVDSDTGAAYFLSDFNVLDVCAGTPCENGGICSAGDGICAGFLCDCDSTDFQGPSCATDIDDCASSPCMNNATCTDAGTNAFFCNCTGTGYEGATCMTDVDDCASSPCMNNGICYDTGIYSFLCNCTGTGFQNDTCLDDVDDCTSSPCMNNGSCTDVGANAIYCNCSTSSGYEGDRCETDVDDCRSSPCQNGGVCSDIGIHAFSCDCASTGFKKDFCHVDVNDCKSNPCQNDGTCTDAGTNAFQCSCTTGFEGASCETNVDDCRSSPCLNGGSCVDGIANVACRCADGYEGDVCSIDIDECLSMPCANGETCIDGVASVTCIAPAADPCLSAPCMNGALCWVAGNHSTFTCDCADGYEGSVCDSPSILQPDPLEIVIEFEDLAENVTLLQVVKTLPTAVTSSQGTSTDDVEVSLIVVPSGYQADDVVLAGYTVEEGERFSITLVYANSEQVSATEVKRRLEESNVPDLATDFRADVKVESVGEEEEGAEDDENEDMTVIIILIIVGVVIILYVFYVGARKMQNQPMDKSPYRMPE